MPELVTAPVLDTWPVIEHFKGEEPSRTALDRLLAQRSPRPVMSTVNLAEVCYILATYAGQPAAADRADQLRRLVRIEPPDRQTALAAAWLKHTYQMALGDTFAAAAAMRHNAELWTGDPELLCVDRCWAVKDLWLDSLRERHQRLVATGERRVGRRPGRLGHLTAQGLAALIDGTFGPAADAPRRGGQRGG